MGEYGLDLPCFLLNRPYISIKMKTSISKSKKQTDAIIDDPQDKQTTQ